jgi:hypothetical protein
MFSPSRVHAVRSWLRCFVLCGFPLDYPSSSARFSERGVFGDAKGAIQVVPMRFELGRCLIGSSVEPYRYIVM